MPKIIRSKPVVLAGGAALVNEILKRKNRKKNRRRTFGTVAGITGGLLVAGLVTKYFTDPVMGQQRRKNLVHKLPGKRDGEPQSNGEWTAERPSSISIPSGTPSQI